MRLIVGTDSIFIDDYLYYLPDNAPLPFTIGDSIRVEASDGLLISGKFSTISFCKNTLSAFDSEIGLMCFQTCSDTVNCSIDFDYNVMDSIVDLTNLSSINPNESDVFQWTFPNGDISSDENPTIEINENGTYNICLNINKSSCLFNSGSINKCESIDIYYPEFVEEDSHFTLTPNDDGIQDYMDLKAGSKIFDRNGSLVLELPQETQWTGTGINNLLLPTGLYTILHQKSNFQVTLVR